MPSCRPSSSAWPRTREPVLPELRAAVAADIPGLLEVFFRSAEDLEERRGRHLQPRNPMPLEQHFGHLIGSDPATAIVADDAGRIVAFGISMVRGSTWFLSFLFVAPEWQGHGIGRAVVAECLRQAGPIERRATCAEAEQRVAIGLYASMGMAPRLPAYVLRGALTGDVFPALPDGVVAAPIQTHAMAALDTTLLGYSRPQDHAFWSQHGRRGWQFQTAHGEIMGYGYAQPSGRVGPVGALDPTHLPSFIGHLARSTSVIEGWQFVVPGPAIAALQPLLQAGLRIDTTPAVYCADGNVPLFDRYLPGSFALL